MPRYPEYNSDDMQSEWSDDDDLSSDESDDELDYLDPEDLVLAGLLDKLQLNEQLPSPPWSPPTLTAQELENEHDVNLRQAEEFAESFEIAPDSEPDFPRSRQSTTSTLWELADDGFNFEPVPNKPKNSYRGQTRNYKAFVMEKGDLTERVLDVLACLKENCLNVPLFLWALLWGWPDLVPNKEAKWARTALMLSDELPQIIEYMHHPPRKHSRGVRTQSGKHTFNKVALGIIQKNITKEMRALTPLMRPASDEISEENFLSIRPSTMISDVKRTAPTLWSLLRCAALTPRQEKRNTKKCPDLVRSILYREFALITMVS